MTQHAPRIAVVGAGPAGLMAAQVLAARGHIVTVYEAKPTPARKLLMAGRGGLNLTHSEALDTFKTRYGAASDALAPIIDTFSPNDLIKWAEQLGQTTFTGSSGRVFPKAMKASPLLRAWMTHLNAQGVTFRFHHKWLGWQANASTTTLNDSSGPPQQTLLFETTDDPQVTQKVDAVILALGGASWPRLGSNGQWVPVLTERGIKITPLTPFNAGVVIPWSQTVAKSFAGEPLKRITATVADTTRAGEAVITQTGLEGGVIYHLNRAITQALGANTHATLTLDLRPDLTAAELTRRLQRPKARQSTATYLRKTAQLSKPAIAILREPSNGAIPDTPEALATLIKAVPLTISRLAPIERAISTAGGVTEQQLDTNAMITSVPGVFVAGEMRDWDAPTGGYLLQATLATAVQAANGTHNWLANPKTS